jgi:GT2 family glycosyltransferase
MKIINTMFLHVSIVTYKTDIVLVRRCLACVYASKVNAVVTIVDNSPTESLRNITQYFDVNYIHNSVNSGYGAGHNLAISKSLSSGFKYHLVLNADVFFAADTLDKILSYMDLNSNVGQIMPKIFNSDGSVQRVCKLIPTPFDLLIRRFLPKFLFMGRKRYFEMWDSGYNKIMFVPYLSGCFMFLRCSVLEDVGVFDEQFFMYPEDIDLTRRIASKYDTLFFPLASVTHDHGAASYKSIRMLYIHAYNICKYFNKWGWFFDMGRQKLNKKALDLIID